ncbi:MAG: DUF4097 domain-containing protein [Bacteroidetes bacterium]|jgi:DUF4097 and DUF4098 domain-containing protein YvlB|nr:DUF4097 domain-containing protein [Bacteroidota bacterium]
MKPYLLLFAFVVFAFVPVAAQRPDAAEAGVRSKSFKVAKGGRLDLSTSYGDIRIKPWSKDEVYVSVTGLDEEDLDRLKMTQTGNDVMVSFRPRSRNWSGGDARFDVNVPSSYSVQLKTSGGDVDVDGPLTGTVEGSTAGGDITLGAINGDVDMSTSGGDIKASEFSGTGKLRTAGGDIRLGKIGGKLDVATSGGDITVESVAKTLDARTAGGDIEVGDVGGEAKLSTSGGDIRVGKVSGEASLSTAGGNLELKGATGRVSAKTSGGDIRLHAVTGSVEARTAGGEVEAEISPSGKGSSRLVSSGGRIVLYLPENAKASVEATIRVHGSWGRRGDRYQVRSDFKADSYEKNEDDEEIRAGYSINGGGERIDLETVNADIEVRKGKAR